MRRFLLAIVLSCLSIAAFAQVTLPQLFSDNMVLQRDTEVPIWGWAKTGKPVTVMTSWDGKEYSAMPDENGRWTVRVATPAAGGPFTLTFRQKRKSVVLKNIMSGDVWLCSGQSNMEMPVKGWGKVDNYEAELEEANNYPNIRLLNIKLSWADAPQDDFQVKDQPGWNVCNDSTLIDFSACAYFFGRELNRDLNIPIGLINSSYGGTCIESWISPGAISTLDSEKEFVQRGKDIMKPRRESVEKNGKSDYSIDFPSDQFRAMIYPLIPFSIKGALWYQGEANDWAAYQYRETLPLLIRDWREQWNYKIPFYIVQLANYMDVQKEPDEESKWAELREAQALSANTVEDAHLAVAIDIGMEKDIHPKNKQEVGRRLGLLARKYTYGENIKADSPQMESYTIEGSSVRIRFRNAESLKTLGPDKTVKGFVIAGGDHKFHFADARIEGSSVVVSCPDVKYPQAVRYAWANNPVCNLYNEVGLPVCPFRTDDWPGVTLGKQFIR